MGMISESIAANTAKKLEKIILTAMNDCRWSDVRSAVRGFVKEELVDWYYDECSETYGSHKPHKDIVEMFPPKQI